MTAALYRSDLDGGDWQERALCAQTDPEAFFPEKGGSTKEAKRICAGCEVKAECLEYALAHDERFGIWGGLSERERRKLRRTGEAPPTCTATGKRCTMCKTVKSREWFGTNIYRQGNRAEGGPAPPGKDLGGPDGRQGAGMMGEELLDRAATAARLGVHPDTVTRYRRRGGFPAPARPGRTGRPRKTPSRDGIAR